MSLYEPCGDGLPLSPYAIQMQQMAREKAIPLSGTFELTPRCNFNCKMCYVHLTPEQMPAFGMELPVSEWIRLAEEAREAGMLYLCITGGEPLVYPGFAAFYRAVSRMGFFITLQTNASLLRGKMLELLDEFPPALVKSTIYGSNDTVYRAVCGIPDGFTQADAGIRAMQERHIPVLLTTTVIRQNMHDLPAIRQYAQERHLPWIYSTAVHPSVRGAATDAAAVSIRPEDATDFREDIRAMLALPPRKKNDKPCDYCKGYRTNFLVTWHGKMRFCTLMREPDFSVVHRPFRDVWQELIDYEENLAWPEECRSCEIKDVCRMCAGGLASRSGSVHRVDKQFCATLKHYIQQERGTDHVQ